MSIVRRSPRIDVNQPAIVEALRKAGCLCWYISRPFDLLVYYHGWHVLEVKNMTGKNQYTHQQQSDLKALAAQNGCQDAVRTVYTPQDALEAVGATHKRGMTLREAIHEKTDRDPSLRAVPVPGTGG